MFSLYLLRIFHQPSVCLKFSRLQISFEPQLRPSWNDLWCSLLIHSKWLDLEVEGVSLRERRKLDEIQILHLVPKMADELLNILNEVSK